MPAALSYRMARLPRSTSNAPSSTASGTTPSHQILIAQIARLSRDGPLVGSVIMADKSPESALAGRSVWLSAGCLTPSLGLTLLPATALFRPRENFDDNDAQNGARPRGRLHSRRRSRADH